MSKILKNVGIGLKFDETQEMSEILKNVDMSEILKNVGKCLKM